jgi:hypothetical protein
MWAHYANNHEGLVFGFQRSVLHDPVTDEFKGNQVGYSCVSATFSDYVNALFEATEADDSNQMVQLRNNHFNLTFARKTKEWENEEEVRCFTQKDVKYIRFNECQMVSIVFGAKCPKGLISKVIESIDDWLIKPKLFKVSLEKSVSRLWIEKYNV